MENLRQCLICSIFALTLCLCFLVCTTKSPVFQTESLFIENAIQKLGISEPPPTNRTTSRWVDRCRDFITDTKDGCLHKKGFWEHYTVEITGPQDMAEMNASCIAAATIFQHQMCDLPCDQAIYMTTWESGTGSGTRWHTYMNAITRTVGTDTMVRLWSTKPFQSYVTSECVSGDEKCYFSAADDCIDRASPNSVANTTKENLVTYTYGKNMKTFTPALREGLNRSEMWLQSQVLFFIMQPKQFIRDWVDEFWSTNSTTRFSTNENIHKDTPYLIMHVRWGDKCAWSSAKRGRESICVPFRKYMEQANAFRALNPELNHIILSSTDPKAIKMTKRHTNWTFSWIVAERKSLSQQNHLIPAKEKLGEKQMVDIKALMTEFYLAAYADYAVVTASSGWSRAFLRWSRALRGHIIPNACLDDWNWDASIVGLNDSRLPEIRDTYRESLGTERFCFAHRENCSEVFS